MKSLITVVLAAGTALAMVAGGAVAAQADQSGDADAQPSAVEDFAYPGADQILAGEGVELIAGDGHILYADCTVPPSGPVKFMEVRTKAHLGPGDEGFLCFRVTGTRGWLTLSVPSVYEIRGDGHTRGTGHKAKADLIGPAGDRKVVDLVPDGSTLVGDGISKENGPATLVKLEVMP
ncbi:hypothetical protein KCV87_00100 [Actinosynnema pretiosum subsp. pretiosum]|uniref:Secreted protein n=1 Tax=Actinosynnema pretiosum subsp. pretiosum TaxID=103721 RepID=A0AA45LEA1_9PSEU|nr:hypothetical protein KCV87_00100 [Actinosynnema pretiosum subsp. pretiosum]